MFYFADVACHTRMKTFLCKKFSTRKEAEIAMNSDASVLSEELEALTTSQVAVYEVLR